MCALFVCAKCLRLYNEMIMLIIGLPHQSAHATSGYAYAEVEGSALLRSGLGPIDAMPAKSGEVVVVVPVSRLAWFELSLPALSHGKRFKPVLRTLLEERLLSDPETQHWVAAPGAEKIARQGGRAWVAVCDKAWLRESMQPLAQAGWSVQRIVPELSPGLEGQGPAQLHVLGVPGQVQCVLCDAAGVQILPPQPAAWSTLVAASRAQDWRVIADPAVGEWAQQHLNLVPQLFTPAQRWMHSVQTEWDLAQDEWAQNALRRWTRDARQAWQALRHGREWRALRWGALALVMVQILGLNILAWQESRDIASMQRRSEEVLRQSFPNIKWVIDAPLQMQRELDQLRKARGQAGADDLETLLSSLAKALPPGQTPQRIDYSNGKLTIQGVAGAVTQAEVVLRAHGVQLKREGESWMLKSQPSSSTQGATP